MELIGIFFIACGLLVLAGVAKAIRPDDTARAFVLLVPESVSRLRSLSMMRQVVRIGALFEAVLGVFALLFPQPTLAALVAASYVLFLGVTAYTRRHGGTLSTCGCFGRPDTPSTGMHVVLNMIFVATALAVTVRPPHFTVLGSLLEHQPWRGMPLLLASAVGVWLAYLAMAPLATLEAARRLVSRTEAEAVSA